MHTSWKLLLLLVCLAGCGKTSEEQTPQAGTKPDRPADKVDESYDFSKELTSDKARELIPRAASISKQEYLDILNHPPVRVREIKNQTLTALLLAVDPFQAKLQNSHVSGDFRYLTPAEESPDPEWIREAILGDPDAKFVSIIQPEYITKCTCLNRGKTASGRVDYRAGNIYAGSADFTAHRQGNDWRIVAFHMPEYRLETTRQSDGSWELVSEEQLLGVVWP